MTQLMRYLILNILGLLMAVFGIYAAVASYPSSGELAVWSKSLPTLAAMLAFGLSVAAVISGLVMLVPLLWRHRRRPGRAGGFGGLGAISSYRLPPSRPTPVRHEEEYEFEPAGFGGGDGYVGDGYEGNRNGSGGNRDVGGIGGFGGYSDSHGERYRGNGQYREMDDRRRVNAYR